MRQSMFTYVTHDINEVLWLIVSQVAEVSERAGCEEVCEVT